MNTTHYAVVDIRTGQTVSTHTTRKQASRRADRLDLNYGAVRFVVRLVVVE